MKYEFKKNATDEYTLKYQDKEFNFKSDVDLTSKLQQAPKLARIEMIKDLAKDGISMKNFTIEEKKDGKTYYDNTNKIELENTYIQNKQLEIIDNVCKEKFNKTMLELIMDIGLDEKEAEKFASDLGSYLSGNIPSGR